MNSQLSSGDWPQQHISGVFNRNCMITYANYRWTSEPLCLQKSTQLMVLDRDQAHSKHLLLLLLLLLLQMLAHPLSLLNACVLGMHKSVLTWRDTPFQIDVLIVHIFGAEISFQFGRWASTEHWCLAMPMDKRTEWTALMFVGGERNLGM